MLINPREIAIVPKRIVMRIEVAVLSQAGITEGAALDLGFFLDGCPGELFLEPRHQRVLIESSGGRSSSTAR
jgi:hypothetical protein